MAMSLSAVCVVLAALAVGILNVRVADIPLFWYGPIEDWGARRHFDTLQRNAFLDQRQRLTDAVASDAPANRIQFRHETVQLLAAFCQVPLVGLLQQGHHSCSKSG